MEFTDSDLVVLQFLVERRLRELERAYDDSDRIDLFTEECIAEYRAIAKKLEDKRR